MIQQGQRTDKNNNVRGYRVASITDAPSKIEKLFKAIQKFNSKTPSSVSLTIEPDGTVVIRMAGSIQKLTPGQESLDQRILQAFKILHSSVFMAQEES